MSNRHMSPSDKLSFKWTCPLTRTGKRSAHSTCAKEFAKEMGFQLIETSDDGNCFFYTLTKFGKRSGFSPFLLESNEHRNAMALRQQLVGHIYDNLEMYEPFMLNNQSVNNQIEELRHNGAWASDVGDLVPIAGANAFGVHINMYNILEDGSRDYVQLVPIRSHPPSDVYISIMRVREGHFQLLWPRSGEIRRNSFLQSSLPQSSLPQSSLPQSSLAQSSLPQSSLPQSSLAHEPSDEKDVIIAAQMAVQAAKVAVKVAKDISTVSNVSESLYNQEKQLNQMVQNLNKLSFGAPRRSTRSTRSTRSLRRSPQSSPRPVRTRSTRKKSPHSRNRTQSYENNNNELRRAIEESIQFQ